MKKILFLLLLTFLFSCDKDDSTLLHKEAINIDIGNKIFDLNSQKGLESYILSVVEEPDAEIVTANLTDFKEIKYRDKYLIQAKYQSNDLTYSLAIGLEKVFSDNLLPGQVYLQSSCQMKCTPNAYCSKCTQAVIEMCVSQDCFCSGSVGPGQCTGKVVFGNQQ